MGSFNQPVTIETWSSDFIKARSVNQTSASFVAKLPQTTDPSGDAGTAIGSSVIQLAREPGPRALNSVKIVPYATDSDGATFSMRVIGWTKAPDPTRATTDAWIPVVLAEFLCTVSSGNPGVAGAYVVATELFSKQIAMTYGNANLTDIVSPNVAGLLAHVVMDVKGFQRLEISFTTGGSATGCNALVSFL